MHDLWRSLSRRLGVQPGVDLLPVPADGRDGAPAVLEPDGPDRKYLLIDAKTASGRRRSFLCLRRVTPESSARVERELQALFSDDCPQVGAPRPDHGLARPPAEVQILPPLFFCKHKNDWIVVVDALAERDDSGAAPDGEVGADATIALLWKGVQDTLAAGNRPPLKTESGALPPPLCFRCERNRSCFAATAEPARPKAALEALFSIMPDPWSGALVEPFDLSLPAWSDLVQGARTDSLAGADELPRIHLDGIEARLAGRRLHLVPRDFVKRAAGEALMLRLEILRQLLEGLKGIRVGLGHPHLDVRPDSIWVRLVDSEPLAPALWGPRVQLLDLAPATRSAGDGAARRPNQHYPPELLAVDSGPRVAITGMAIPRGEVTEEEEQPGVNFLFLPEQDSEVVPKADERVTVAVIHDGRETHSVDGRIEVAFPDVFRLVLFPGEIPAADLAGILRTGSQTVIRLGANQPEPDPDLFAAGTIWLGMLRKDAGDLAAAAGMRDEMLRAIREEEVQPSDHEAAERICLETALEIGGLFADAALDREAGIGTPTELQLLGRCLWLGLRMCLLTPGTDPEREIAGFYENLLREVRSLLDEARYLMLGRSSAEEEILSVLRAYEAEWSER